MASPGHDSYTPVSGQEDSSRDRSNESSAQASRGGSRPPREKHRVRFNQGGESIDTAKQKTPFDLRDDDSGAPAQSFARRLSSTTLAPVQHARHSSAPSLHLHSEPSGRVEKGESSAVAPTGKMKAPLRPSIVRLSSSKSTDLDVNGEDPAGLSIEKPKATARPSIMRMSSSASIDSDEGLEMPLKRTATGPLKKRHRDDEEKDDDEDADGNDDDNESNDEVGKMFSEKTAFERAARLSRSIGTRSAPVSRQQSPARKAAALEQPLSPPPGHQHNMPIDLRDIPLEKLNSRRTKYGIEDESDDSEQEDEKETRTKGKSTSAVRRIAKSASRIVRENTDWRHNFLKAKNKPLPLQSGQVTPVEERDPFDYIPRPNKYREGYLSSLMRLYDQQGVGSAFAHIPWSQHAIDEAIDKRTQSNASLVGSAYTTPAQTPQHSPKTSGEFTETPTPATSPPHTGTNTPKGKHEKWYYKNREFRSTGSIADLVASSTSLAQVGAQGSKEHANALRPKPKYRPRSQQALDTVLGKKKKLHRDEDIRIQIHMAETIQRKEYILKMCKALMCYGAPTHRLEEYLKMSARVLSIDSQFLYIPGCMIVSFDDSAMHTTEVKIVRTSQAVNLGKLLETHQVYKEVVHDTIGVEEAITRLDTIIKKPNRYSLWFLVFIYGVASACVGPFAFGARPIDLPFAFFLGCLLGFMQLILAPYSELYSNIFEISAAVLTSFLARALGSIKGGNIFCFSALAQSSIALILPGYLVLCGSLELQSKNIVAGSVRMVYAIIYSFFLGFGITIGSSLYGWADHNATSATTCSTEWPFWWKIIFVPPFTLCLILINQGKAKQMPVMLVIAMVGYVVNHFSAIRFASNAQIANTLGALAIGILGNSYSRLRHGLAVTALLPAIFVQVPSGLAASGSLVSGITNANQITNSSAAAAANNGAASGSLGMNSAVLNVGFSMIEVAIGITVGLFLSALVIYPFGKRRSGLFSF